MQELALQVFHDECVLGSGVLLLKILLGIIREMGRDRITL